MVVNLILLVVGIGLSLLAGYLAQKKARKTVDDTPTILSERGSYVPMVKGRRRVGFVFAYAGNRIVRREKVPGTGSWASSSQRTIVFYEDAWHLICVGPAYALHEIEENGVPLMTGTITRDSHPSGTLVDLGNNIGKFRIYWGDNTQPINSGQLATNVGVASRWKGVCYIEWVGKRLGGQTTWGNITYVIETRPQTTLLVNSQAYIPDTFDLQADTPTTAFTIANYPGAVPPAVLQGAPGVGYIIVDADQPTRFNPDDICRLVGNSGISDRDLTVASVSVFNTERRYWTTIRFKETIPAGITATGKIFTYVARRIDGWNGAHIIAELLFDPWPRGLALDTADWDIQSLEDLGVLIGLDGEDLRCSMIAQDGQDARAALSALMQDLGVMLPIDMSTGLLKFVPVRRPQGSIPAIPEDAILDRPEIEVLLGGRAIDRVNFTFPDEANAFRTNTIGVDDDGQAALQSFFRARTAQIASTTNFLTAARISERRAAEELSGGSEVKLQLGRGARALVPGTAITAAGVDDVLRITGTSHDPLSGNVTVSVLTDFYGVPLSDFVTNEDGTTGGGDPIEVDYASSLLELPELLLGAGSPITLLTLAVRANNSVYSHYLHLSTDGTTYNLFGSDLSIMTGGVLIDALSADSSMEPSVGPTFTLQGPDASSVEDLTFDPVGWRRGRQIVAVVHPTTNAVVLGFLNKISLVSGSTWRLDGVIWARYDTRLATFPAGSFVYIFQADDDGYPIIDPVLAPGATIYVKSQPVGAGTIDLAWVTPAQLTLYGKGTRPVPVSGVRLNTGSGSAGSGTALWGDTYYATTGAGLADDLIVRWSYSTPQTPGSGAGEFGFGQLVADAAPEGEFFVEILTAADAVVRTATAATATYTYTRANRLVDFGVEPASFKVRVTQRRGGYSSTPVTQTFTKTN